MLFGNPTRYWQLDPRKIMNVKSSAGGNSQPSARDYRQAWDRAVESGRVCYNEQMYNFFINSTYCV